MPLGLLSRSSGCIYLTHYIISGMRCNTPHLVSQKLYKAISVILPKKKRVPLGLLSRSSGCIYLTHYIISGVRCNTPHLVSQKLYKVISVIFPKKKESAAWAALQIIRVHLLNTLYHIWREVQYPSYIFSINFFEKSPGNVIKRLIN